MRLRLNGWKSIAAHFGRERTTVIRWSAERGMPVHRIPGAGRASVYALTEELDAWLSASRSTLDGAALPLQAPWPGRLRERVRRRWRMGTFALIAASVLGIAVYARPGLQPPSNVQMPNDDKAAAIFVDARADWARRTPDSILGAIDKLQQVVAIEPGFAAGYSALADSYLLAREFGSIPDADAFGRAQVAVDTALKIDPDNAGALRAKGFIDYWWRGDLDAAGSSFRRSLAIDDKSAQTLFWYANALIDNGDFEEGMRRFAEAQLIEPASPAIAADLAWARWSTGDAQAAKAALLRLRRDHPSLATIPDYLSVIALAEGDPATFLSEIETMARLRREEGLTDHAAELRAALDDGTGAMAGAVVDRAVAEVDTGERRTLVWPAFVASASGDRAMLLRVLRKAAARNEAWGSAGLRRHIAEKWKRDAEVASLLADRKTPPLVLPSDSSTASN